MGAFQVVPSARLARPAVRQQNVTGLFGPVAVNHHFNAVARTVGNSTVGQHHLLQGNKTFGLVAEVYDHLFIGDFEDVPLKQFSVSWWGKMTILIQKLSVVLFLDRSLSF